MREQGEVLEDNADVPLVGRDPVDELVVEPDLAGARLDQPDLLRLALAAIILLVALRMALGLAWRPDEIYTIDYL